MSELSISGCKRLYGEIDVSGAKNSVLPLLAATYLCDGDSVLHNCPNLTDVNVSLEILECLGCKTKREGNTITVSSCNCENCTVPECLMREMRSSVVFMGAVASKNKRAVLSLPGGCELGPRPIDIHIESLRRMGADIEFCDGRLECEFRNGVNGAEINLRFPSVGATENIMLAAVIAKGTTIIKNAAREPEICDLACFLNSAGADIKGAGGDTIVINGVERLRGTEHYVMPDRIVSATYMFAVAACKGKVRLRNAVPEHIAPIITALKDSGCDVDVNNGVIVTSNGKQKAVDCISTQPYPGFPTDAGPMFISFASVTQGTSVFVENIFDNRFRYIDELRRFGANIKTVGRVAVVTGVRELSGAVVTAHDLRGGAALVIASLCAKGESIVRKVCYIDRGYDKIEKGFNLLGANIKRI